jgi:two-component system OmpR family sensor kinase
MMTIRRKLLIGLLGGTLGCTLIAGIVMYLHVQDEANELFDYQLKQVAGSLPAQLSSHEKMPGTEDSEEDIVIQAWDRSGNLLYTSQPALSLPRSPEAGFRTVSALHDRWRVYGEMRHDRFVQVAQPTSVRQELAAGLALRSLLPFLILIPVLALLIYVVVGRSLLPLRRVAQAVGQRSPSALQPLSIDGQPPEIQPMIDALNDLLRQLEKALLTQRAFVADAAHELRSPLTALKLQLQLAERANTDEQRSAAFAKLHDRLDRSTHLVHQLLTLARHEPNQAAQHFQFIDLQKLAQQRVADQYMVAESKGIDLGVETGATPVLVKGNIDSLCVLLNNLIDNALRYTPAGGRIDVSVFVDNGRPVLQVSDNGPGIPEEERSRVFDRFYRRDESGTWGSGLGLSIVKNIADIHEAEIHLGDNAFGQGLTIALVFQNEAS